MNAVIEKVITDEEAKILTSPYGSDEQGRIAIFENIERSARALPANYTDAALADFARIDNEINSINYWLTLARLAPHASDPAVAANMILKTGYLYSPRCGDNYIPLVPALNILVDGVKSLAPMIDKAVHEVKNASAYEQHRLEWLHLWLQSKPGCFYGDPGTIALCAVMLNVVQEQIAQNNRLNKAQEAGSPVADIAAAAIARHIGVPTSAFALPGREIRSHAHKDFVHALRIVQENYNPDITFATAEVVPEYDARTTLPALGQTQRHYKIKF